MGEKNQRGSVMDYLSKLGQSLMLPIAALSAVGLLLGVMSALTKDAVIAAVPAFAPTAPVGFVFATIKAVANAVYAQIPVLFAICLALGLAAPVQNVEQADKIRAFPLIERLGKPFVK